MNISNKISGLPSLGIARKIGLSFTVLGILLAIVAGISFDVTNGAKIDMDEVVIQYELKTVVSLELSGNLQEASKAMGFYLLGQEHNYRKADELEGMITSLQNDVGTAATTMENEREQANIIVEQVEKTSLVFESIYNSVSSIRERNDAIEHAAQNQKTKAEQVAEIVETLMENAAGSQQTHSAANELTTLEVKLKQNMTQFKV